MYKLALSRPVTTLMFALSLVLFGLYALNKLPKALFPDVDFPVVIVQTIYKGASAEIVESKVTDKIEEAVMAIDGIKSVSSNSAKNVSLVTLLFELEKPLEVALNDVRDKVGAVILDSGIDRPIVQRVNTGSTPVLSLFISTKDGKNARSTPDLMKHTKQILAPLLQRIDGVGNVDIGGYRDRQIRILIDPTRLNKYQLSYTDISSLLSRENLEADGGRLVDPTNETSIVIRANSRLEELENLSLREGLRLGDIAEIQEGLAEERSYSTYRGKSGLVLGIQKISGANEIAIANGVRDLLSQLRDLSPGYDIEIIWDTTKYIHSALSDIQFDLALGACLAVLVVFLFLRNTGSTLVSAISLPLSILGTFFFVYLLGFTLNMLTLLALTLAIGIIIDDAIVVLENIHKKLEGGLAPLDAAKKGVGEIGFAILAISAMLLAVFIPIGTMRGIAGKFFASFGLSVALAVVISYVVVVTVIPLLSSLFIKKGESRFYLLTRPFFERLDKAYVDLLSFILRDWKSRLVALAIVFGIFVLSLVVASGLGSEFLLKEDRSQFQITLKAKPGISIDSMKQKASLISSYIESDSMVDFVSLEVGPGELKQPFLASLYVALKPLDERKSEGKQGDQFVILQRILDSIKALPEASGLDIFGSEVPLFGGGRDNTAIQLAIFSPLDSVTKASVDSLEKFLFSHPSLKGRISDFHLSTSESLPALILKPIRRNLVQFGLSSNDIAQALALAFSGEMQISYYKEEGKEYAITMRAMDSRRISIEDLARVQVRNANGDLIFIEGLVEIEEGDTSTNITRFNRQRSITVALAPKESSGLSVGEVLKLIKSNAKEGASWLKPGADYKLMGQASNLADTLSAFGLAIALAFVLMYLILASLYESFLQPLIIMVTMPLSFSGAFFAVKIAGGSQAALSIFSIMGLLLLMGLVGKNATLLVDVANERLRAGHPIIEAIKSAAKSRLRPILMTTIAMVAGLLPLALATGDASSMKQPIGLSMIGGLLVSMLLSLLVVPVFYCLITPLDEKLQRLYRPEAKKESHDN